MRLHPSNASITVGPEGEECTIYPATYIPLGECVVVDGFEVRRFSEHYACTCPAWRYAADVAVSKRTCDHLADVLGALYEKERTKEEVAHPGHVWLPRTPTKRGSAHMARAKLVKYLSPESSPSKRQKTTPTKSVQLSPSSSVARAEQDHTAIMVQGGEEPPQLIGRVDVKLFLLLANTWPSLPDGHSATTKDPTGWWISEKLDGVRALWDGRCLWSRRGKPWSAPTWFTEQLPADMPLDGELWIGRGLFEHTSSVCRSTTSDEWHHIKYMIFDTPGWQTERVEERWARLERVFPVAESDQWRSLKAGPYLVKHTRCTCVNHLNDLLDHVLSLGGEGVMLRRPESLYEKNRSTTLYKLKPVHDGEARVVGYEEGQHGITGLVGSLVCETLEESPRRFRVGSGLTEHLRKHPPSIGTIITYQYGGIGSQGLPRFPRYHGVRADV